MKLPTFIKQNVLLKMTSLNAIVIGVRLVISFWVQRIIAEIVGEAGVAKIGSLRNLIQILTSFSSLGVFNGVVKYVSEHKADQKELAKLFSTTFVLTLIGCSISMLVLVFASKPLSVYLFQDEAYSLIIIALALVVPAIALNRVFNGVVNGLSRYKEFSKIELVAYVLSTVILVVMLLKNNIYGALLAIAITPAIQMGTLLFIFIKVLRDYIDFKNISFKVPYLKILLAFSLMSFASTILSNSLEIYVRDMVTQNISASDAGIWTAMTNISKNYMVFSNALFGLYVLPKFAGITSKSDFLKELGGIYKTLLPIFGLGMLLIYIFRDYVIALVYPDFLAMSPLFKWQLLGDFIKLASLVLGYQFVAKKMVRNFIFTELLSLVLFYAFAKALISHYGVEGVVMANFARYIIYFVVVIFLVLRYFRKQSK